MKPRIEIISLVKTNDHKSIDVTSDNAYNTIKSTILGGPDSGFNKQELLQILKYPNYEESSPKESKLKGKNKYLMYRHTDLAMHLQTSGIVINRSEISKKTGNFLYNKLDCIRKECLQEQKRLSKELINTKKIKMKKPCGGKGSRLLNINVNDLMYDFPGTPEKESELLNPYTCSPSSKRKSNYMIPSRRNTAIQQLDQSVSLMDDNIKIQSSIEYVNKQKLNLIVGKSIYTTTDANTINNEKQSLTMKSGKSIQFALKPSGKNSFIEKRTDNLQSNKNSSQNQRTIDFFTKDDNNPTIANLDKIYYENQDQDQGKKLTTSYNNNLDQKDKKHSKLNYTNQTSGISSLGCTLTECLTARKSKVPNPELKASKILNLITEIRSNSESISQLSKTVNSSCFSIKELVKEKYNPKYNNLSEQISLFPKIVKRNQNIMPSLDENDLRSNHLKNADGNDYIIICKSLRDSVNSKKFQTLCPTIEKLVTKMELKNRPKA